jgi:hypothetical protein
VCVCVCMCVVCAVGTETLNIIQDNRRPGTDSRSVYVRFVVSKVAVEQGFLGAFRFSSVYIYHSINAPHSSSTHLLALTRRTNGRRFGTFQKASPFRKSGNIWTETYFYTNVKINVLYS